MPDTGVTGGLFLFRVRERLRMSLWFAPGAGVIAAVAGAAALVALDRRFPQDRTGWFLFTGGADSARNLLSVIAASMVTSISLIFSVTMVVLQLASGQYSPRVLRSFIRDRLVEVVLAAYIATFVYCLLLLPAVRSAADGESEYVPAASVSVALLLALVSLGLFVRYVHHIAHAIRGITIINAVADETRSALERLYPEEIGREPAHPDQSEPALGEPDHLVAWSDGPGVLVAVDEDALMETVESEGLVVELRKKLGDFLPTGMPLFSVWGTISSSEALTRCVTVGDERTMQQDPAYGFRQLVDIAERALSPGVNDPTTAVQCIDQLHDLLRRIAPRHLPSPVRLGTDGTVRVIAHRLGWDDYVALAFDEIRHYSGRSVQVMRRLQAALEDLLAVAPPPRVAALEQQLALLDSTRRREFEDEQDRRSAAEGSAVG